MINPLVNFYSQKYRAECRRTILQCVIIFCFNNGDTRTVQLASRRRRGFMLNGRNKYVLAILARIHVTGNPVIRSWIITVQDVPRQLISKFSQFRKLSACSVFVVCSTPMLVLGLEITRLATPPLTVRCLWLYERIRLVYVHIIIYLHERGKIVMRTVFM